MPWKHNYTFTYRNGKVRVTCKPCGISSHWFPTNGEEWKEWCNKHPGLREKGEMRHASKT